MTLNEFFPSPDFDDSEKRRDTYQAQTSGGSVDYDFDKVQVQDVDQVQVSISQTYFMYAFYIR